MTPDQERKQEDHIKSSHCERFRFTHLLQCDKAEGGGRQELLVHGFNQSLVFSS